MQYFASGPCLLYFAYKSLPSFPQISFFYYGFFSPYWLQFFCLLFLGIIKHQFWLKLSWICTWLLWKYSFSRYEFRETTGKHVKRIRHWAIVNLMEDVFTYAVSFQVFRVIFKVTTYSVVGKGSLECSSTWYNDNLLEWIEEKATLTESRRCENVMLLPQTLWIITSVGRSWCLVSAFIK